MLQSPCDELKLIPREEAPFLEMWKGLLDCPVLWIPVGRGRDGKGHCIAGPGALSFVDSVTLPSPDGRTVSLLYTDWRLFRENVAFAEVPTAEALKRIFDSSRSEGAAFNVALTAASWTGDDGADVPELTGPTGFSCTIWKTALARLLGLVQSPDPLASSGYPHGELAGAALEEDALSVALHHAVSARELSGATPDSLFVELSALLGLGFEEEAGEAFSRTDWGGRPHEKILRSRLLTTQGRPDEAVDHLDAAPLGEELEDLAHLERGRAHLMARRLEPALEAFERCLARNERCLEAWLGRGVALQDLEGTGDTVTLRNEALRSFEQVTRRDGQRAAEAWARASSVYLDCGMWERAEQAARASLRRRFSRCARRNLILSLHGQGHVEEARRCYDLGGEKGVPGA